MATLVLALGIVLNTAAGGASRTACSISALPVFRDSAATYLVGTALGDTARAAPGGPPVGLRGLPPTPPRASYGQVVRAEHLRGPDSARLERAFARQRLRDVLVVPWSYGPACQPIPWSTSARWAPVAAQASYRLRLRPEAEWGDGPPVFDALYAEVQPYPYGVLEPPLSETPSLTPKEFVDLYAALPTDGEAVRDPAAARRALDAWERAHPELATRFPAAAVLRSARATLAAQTAR
jgi:hypothetical protein